MTHDHDPDFTNPKLNGAQTMSDAETIAEVLAAHKWYDASSSEADEPAIGCTGCDDWFSDEDALDNGVFAAHQAAALEPVIREREKKAWARGVTDLAAAASEEQTISYIAPRNPYGIKEEA